MFSLGVMILLIHVSFAAVIVGLYEGKKGDYRQGRARQPESVRSFKAFYIYLHIATPIIVVMSCLGYDRLALYSHPAVMMIGTTISALGVAIFVGAKMRIGEEFAPCNDAYLPRDVIRDGVYKHVRHPIYAAFILFFLGIAITTANPITLLNWLVLGAYYVRSARFEEKALLEKFPVYEKYSKSTGRFIPRIVQSKND
ncbi:MAG TPA: isoprenylcysteine carboxylmethyltransferase family protein [Oligoflexus sp.]|uniref:methyltransferase family protein n=1 Tax=Oligoflexus sp. TaxID=1971216 RepID=UPI002D61C166|nr:isoprenylcysteine carboxylmethyltransferase family protein [Oligoflexus sp.]HYX38087.1 isoprenylcysteine carboxylmethyltransferase family protein [Oligoflexus sp.]